MPTYIHELQYPYQFARLQDLDDRINELGLNVLTQTITVVTGVDFEAKTITTEEITFVTNVKLTE